MVSKVVCWSWTDEDHVSRTTFPYPDADQSAADWGASGASQRHQARGKAHQERTHSHKDTIQLQINNKATGMEDSSRTGLQGRKKALVDRSSWQSAILLISTALLGMCLFLFVFVFVFKFPVLPFRPVESM